MQTRCHLSVLALKLAEKYGDRAAFTYKDFGGTAWKQMSYNRFAQLVKQASNALLNLGIKPQDTIGVFSQNTIQYLITDFGAYGVRTISIPFYATASEQQIQYMINDAGIRFLFVGMTRRTVYSPFATRLSASSYSTARYAFPLTTLLRSTLTTS